MDLMESELRNLIGKVGAQIGKVGQVNWNDALNALESQIKVNGGLNIGDRWRLRFKDDACNKDFFIQDKNKKGYYRFKTTACDNVVKNNDCQPCCNNE